MTLRDHGADAELLLSLYRDAMTLPAADFQDRAIRMLRRALRFESSIWGQGYLAGPGPLNGRLVPLQVHTQEIDPAGFEQWKSINRADKVIPIVLAAPGRTHAFHAPTLFSGQDDGVMRDYAQRFGRQSYLITAFGAPGSTLREWCSLYRPDPHDQFTGLERRRCENLMSHLTQAMSVNGLLHHAAAAPARPETAGPAGVHTALATRSGRLVSAQPGFLAACAGHWREFDGHTLPQHVVRRLADGPGVIRLARFTLSGRPIADLWWLRLQETPAPAVLPPRRLDIALLFAEGQSTKQIARSLGLAHSTVRNQLVAAYRTLGVSTRTGLRASLRDSGATPS